MNRTQKEHIKTGLLVFVVLLSFLFSGYLWYSTPATEVVIPDNDIPPYIFKGPQYNNKERFELISPFQLVTHKNHQSALILPNEYPSYKNTVRFIQQLDIYRFEEISPTKRDWMKAYQSKGIECFFPSTYSFNTFKSFLGKTLSYHGTSGPVNYVNRLWIFSDPSTRNVRVWIISTKDQKIAQASAEIEKGKLEKLLSTIDQTKQLSCAPFPIVGALPWENNTRFVSRYAYLPTDPFNMNQLVYHTKTIDIDHMKQWLFREPDIKPLVPNLNEFFYMYNDQLLSYNQKYHYMVYSDTSSVQEKPQSTISNKLDQIKNFVQRHQGWTGLYLLENIHNGDTFSFRLFSSGYPVFWENPPENVPPDIIQLQTGATGVTKYTRSMRYLSLKPTKKNPVQLKHKVELLKEMQQIGINHIDSVFPGYRAKEITMHKQKTFQLDPVWVIQKTNGEKKFIEFVQ